MSIESGSSRNMPSEIASNLQRAVVRPQEKAMPVAGRLLVNLSTLPAIPFAFVGAAFGAIAAKIINGDTAKGGRAGSLVAGGIASTLLVVPLLGLMATAAFYSIRGIKPRPDAEPQRPENAVELMNKTWANACAILETCFPNTNEEVVETGPNLHELAQEIIEKRLPYIKHHEDNAGVTDPANYSLKSYKDEYKSFIARASGYSGDEKTMSLEQLKTWVASVRNSQSEDKIHFGKFMSEETILAVNTLFNALTIIEGLEKHKAVLASARGAAPQEYADHVEGVKNALADVLGIKEKVTSENLKQAYEAIETSLPPPAKSLIKEQLSLLSRFEFQEEKTRILSEIQKQKPVFETAMQTKDPKEYSKQALILKSALSEVLGLKSGHSLEVLEKARQSKEKFMIPFTDSVLSQQFERLNHFEKVIAKAEAYVKECDAKAASSDSLVTAYRDEYSSFIQKNAESKDEAVLLAIDVFKDRLAVLSGEIKKEDLRETHVVHTLQLLREVVDSRLKAIIPQFSKQFLTSIGFKGKALPDGYTSERPKDMRVVVRNLGILEANIGEPLSLEAAKNCSKAYYDSLEGMMKVCSDLCTLKLGLDPKDDGAPYSAQELMTAYKTLSEGNPPQIEKDDNLDELIDGLLRLESGRERDKTLGQQTRQHNLGTHPSAAELFFSKLGRSKNEHETSVEIFNSSRYLSMRNISQEKPQLEALPPVAKTSFKEAGVKIDRDSWKSKFPDAVGFSKDHSFAVSLKVNEEKVKIILTVDGEGHMGESEAAREKTEEQMKLAVKDAKKLLESKEWKTKEDALNAFRDNFEAGMKTVDVKVDPSTGKRTVLKEDGTREEVSDDFITAYKGKPMIAMVDSGRAYFVRDKEGKADGGFIILGKEGRMTLIAPDDVPYTADITQGDRLIAFTDGVFDGLVEAGLKPLADKALSVMSKEVYESYRDRLRQPYLDHLQIKQIGGVQQLLQNLSILKTAAEGYQKDQLNSVIDDLCEKEPYLKDLKPTLEAFFESEQGKNLSPNDVTRLRLEGFLKLFQMEKGSLQKSIAQLSDIPADKRSNSQMQDLLRYQLVLALMESPHFSSLQPTISDEELDSLAKNLLSHLISEQIGEVFTSQTNIFRPQDTTPSKKYDAYPHLDTTMQRASNKFMDDQLNAMFNGDQWVGKFAEKLSSEEMDIPSLIKGMHHSKKSQVEAALCRKMLPVALGGVGESLDEAMEQLNGFAVSALISSSRPIHSLDDSTVVGTLIE